ncbi:NAD-dependent epimerase/dehydratase family protein [Streptomyces sp. NPDC052727]|uniref:NAD-dependent epimerase/dehydratase family protein n=1 Tax=unclassified Streptomyces TaxID=2593676 RepID=UPI00343304A4
MWDINAPGRPVLVTGGAGFIGGHLVRALTRAGHRVRVLDDLSTGRPDTSAGLPGVELVRGSVLDPGAVAAAAAGTGLVLHLAGVVGMRLAAEQAGLAHRVGRTGTANVLAHTGDVPVVLFSSSAVYGLSDGRAPLAEDTPIDRSVPLAYDGGSEGYATGKWELERLGAEAVAAGRPVLVVRPFNVVGPGQRSRYGMVLPTFLRQAAAGQALTVHGDGSQRRCFTEVTQFTDRLLRLMAAAPAWRPGGNVYNIGSTRETSIGELARLVLAATGSTAGVVHVPYEQVFPGRSDVTGRVPATDRLRAVVGETRWLPAAEIVASMSAGPARSRVRVLAT